MIQNCLNCKLKNISLSSSINIKSSNTFSSNDNNNSEKLLRQVTIKYSKPSELEQKKYYIFYEKPKIVQPAFNNNILNKALSSKFFLNSTPTYKYSNSYNKYKAKYNPNNKIYINAQPKNPFKKSYNNDLINNDIENKKIGLDNSLNNSQEKIKTNIKKNKLNK